MYIVDDGSREWDGMDGVRGAPARATGRAGDSCEVQLCMLAGRVSGLGKCGWHVFTFSYFMASLVFLRCHSCVFVQYNYVILLVDYSLLGE